MVSPVLSVICLSEAEAPRQVVGDVVRVFLGDRPEPGTLRGSIVGRGCLPKEGHQPSEEVAADSLSLKVGHETEDDYCGIALARPAELGHADRTVCESSDPGPHAGLAELSSPSLVRPSTSPTPTRCVEDLTVDRPELSTSLRRSFDEAEVRPAGEGEELAGRGHLKHDTGSGHTVDPRLPVRTPHQVWGLRDIGPSTSSGNGSGWLGERVERAVRGVRHGTMTSMTVNVVAIFRALPEHRDELKRRLEVMAAATHQEEGCLLYALQEGVDDPNVLGFVEKWESAEALARHQQSDHVRNGGEERTAMMAAPAVVITTRNTDDQAWPIGL